MNSSGPPADIRPHAIDAAHLERQREFSRKTFGPGSRTLGVIDHIRKELQEIEDNPTDLSEWVDVLILAFDGAWRAGWEPQEIIDAIKAKQAKNEARTWPDWRTMSEDKAIEHDRSNESTGRSKRNRYEVAQRHPDYHPHPWIVTDLHSVCHHVVAWCDTAEDARLVATALETAGESVLPAGGPSERGDHD